MRIPCLAVAAGSAPPRVLDRKCLTHPLLNLANLAATRSHEAGAGHADEVVLSPDRGLNRTAPSAAEEAPVENRANVFVDRVVVCVPCFHVLRVCMLKVMV